MDKSQAMREVWAALRQDAAWLDLDQRAAVMIRGPDAVDLLHRVTSQDVRGLAVGGGAPACILTAKGKMQALFWLFRPASDLFLAETARANARSLRDQIDRFVFAERIAVELPDWRVLGLFGPRAPALVAEAPPGCGVVAAGDGFLVRSDELGVPGLRFHVPAAAAAALSARVPTPPRGSAADFDGLRIDAGWPELGADADDTTIPLEVGLAAACSTTKGCYVGQEVIARIHTYGHVNRQLCRLVIEGSCPGPGALVYDEGLEAGRVTSCYVSPGDGKAHALAMLPRLLVSPGPALRVGAPDGPAAFVVS
jgi:folate-binding protein YgfZ